ncbi:MAG: hypothetical protein JNL70_12360 [Saprospiraceae bacterium]|nr:hypothetical protein [Saprospiraceae bacterium]
MEGLLSYGVLVAELYKGKGLFVGIFYGLRGICFWGLGLFESFMGSLKNAFLPT